MRLGTRWQQRLAVVILTVLFATAAAAQVVDPLPFKNRREELRFQQLTAQLRCLVCQNENLADSAAGLAQDLRHEIWAQMQRGKSDQAIKRYMTARYSDFILYDPPLKPATWLLWFGPFLLLSVGTIVVVLTIRRHHRASSFANPADGLRELK
jgi:cytochrome c-type biogenesis protein CcmH